MPKLVKKKWLNATFRVLRVGSSAWLLRKCNGMKADMSKTRTTVTICMIFK